jgi:hypothetical protein
VVVVLEEVVKSEPTKPGPSSATSGVILGAVEGGGELAGVQPESATATDVEPSPTVALQVLDVKPEALTLKSPFEPARPVAVDSGDETLIVAFARAPLPSTVRFPELSEARFTLTAAIAPDGASSSPPTTSGATTAMAVRPRENSLLEGFMSCSDELVSGERVVPLAIGRTQHLRRAEVTGRGPDVPVLYDQCPMRVAPPAPMAATAQRGSERSAWLAARPAQPS